MQIAPGVSAADWRALKLDNQNSPDWNVGVQILERRIHDRFMEPVDYLITTEQAKAATERRFGFTILAVDCLLVETMQAFTDGLEDTEGKSKPTFCKFLTTRPSFAACFTTEELAKRFYKEFRCGILHQAETGGGGKVWSVGPLLQIDGGRIIVNRNKFHECLKAEFRSYLAELRDPANVGLRANFRKKMDFISQG